MPNPLTPHSLPLWPSSLATNRQQTAAKCQQKQRYATAEVRSHMLKTWTQELNVDKIGGYATAEIRSRRDITQPQRYYATAEVRNRLLKIWTHKLITKLQDGEFLNNGKIWANSGQPWPWDSNCEWFMQFKKKWRSCCGSVNGHSRILLKSDMRHWIWGLSEDGFVDTTWCSDASAFYFTISLQIDSEP